MQNTPHTPAPWSMSGHLIVGAPEAVPNPKVKPYGKTLASLAWDYDGDTGATERRIKWPEAKANGDLMVAAPELLASLQHMLQWARHFAEVLNEIDETAAIPCGVAADGPFAGCVADARAAINKALGIVAD